MASIRPCPGDFIGCRYPRPDFKKTVFGPEIVPLIPDKRAAKTLHMITMCNSSIKVVPSITLNLRNVLFAVLAGLAFLAVSNHSYAASEEFADIRSEITKRHDEAVKRLQDWIALPSIAAEDRNYPAGAEYMAQLARDAGFQKAVVISTEGKPGVFATLDAGASKTVGVYFMYDVKQFDPSEWTSPPLKARLVEKP